MKTNFTPSAIIKKKRDKKQLTKDEIQWFINGLVEGKIPEYQMSALLMAIYLNGMTTKETAALTDCMLYSGRVLDFADPTVIDKHSTGGVGDKASFILAPLAAACGVKVPMIAGRGLGHTGGTVDKIESIKGFKTSISLTQFEKRLKKDGIVLIGQTKDIAPADKIIYSLRDVTATVESIPLITASIMSKKLAEGAAGIVMDIKTGQGAFMKNKTQARALAKSIRETGLRFGKNMMTILTDMNQPLGDAVGNSLEIIESIEVLKNRGPKDITDISVELAGGMIHIAGLADSHEKGKKMARAALKSGAALKKFEELIANQGGDPKVCHDYSRLPLAKERTEIVAQQAGYISSMNNERIGLLCVDLGGRRKKVSDKIDFGVGFIFHKKIGQRVKKGEPILTVYHHAKQQALVDSMQEEFNKTVIKISKTKPKALPLIIEKSVSWSK
jgi:pyrimidine-nucleoside phosphorylase